MFALQLLALTLTATFGYSAFSCLYKVCYNGDVYVNVQLSLACSTSLALYVAGSAVMLLSTMTVFEYGSHYFAEKLRIIERKHRNPESFVKQTIVVNSGCQGYVPHSCAMAALVAFAACKGPVIYDLVSLYRPTQDRLVLTGLVCEVCYMVLWIALWFGLTVKQRWQFRILDYVPLGQPLFMIQDDQIVKNPTFDRSSGSGDGSNSLEMAELPSRSRRRSRNGGESPPGYQDAVDNGSGDVTPDHDPANSEAGTEDSDTANLNDNMADIDCLPSLSGNGGGAMRKVRSRGRRHGGPRVTFDDSVRSNGRRASGGGGDGDPAAGHSAKPGDGSRHLNVKADVHNNVKADVHNNVKSSGSAVAAAAPPSHSGDGSAGNLSDARAGGVGGVGVGGVGGVKLRKQSGQTENTLSREYRNSIRSKCDDFYAVVEHPCPSDNLNNLSPQPDAAVAAPPSSSSSSAASSSAPAASHEPLPTLMSSFRDKVKESSRTASNYREQRRNLQLGNYGSLDRQTAEYPPGPGPPAFGLTNGVGGGSLADLERQGCDKRRGIVEGELGEVTLRLDDSLDSGVRSSKRGSTVSGSDDDRHNHSFQHDARNSSSNNPGGIHHLVPRCNSLHKQSNSVANSTFESENSSLPSITENRQPGVAGVVSDKPPRQLGKMDYLSIDKAGPAFPRSLHLVPRTKAEIGRRDSANYSLTSSQETSSNDSDHGQGLCSQV